MNKFLILFSALILAASCKKDETASPKCTACATGTFTADYCEGDTVLIVKNNGTQFQKVSFKVSLDSFKRYAADKYKMTCK